MKQSTVSYRTNDWNSKAPLGISQELYIFLKKHTNYLWGSGYWWDDGPRHSNHKEDLIQKFVHNQKVRPSVLTQRNVEDHLEGCDKFYFTGTKNFDELTLIMIDIDCHLGWQDDADEAVEAVREVFPNIYVCGSPRGRNGYILVDRRFMNARNVNLSLSQLELALQKLLLHKEIKASIEIKGHLQYRKGDSYYCGKLAKLPNFDGMNLDQFEKLKNTTTLKVERIPQIACQIDQSTNISDETVKVHYGGLKHVKQPTVVCIGVESPEAISVLKDAVPGLKVLGRWGYFTLQRCVFEEGGVHFVSKQKVQDGLQPLKDGLQRLLARSGVTDDLRLGTMRLTPEKRWTTWRYRGQYVRDVLGDLPEMQIDDLAPLTETVEALVGSTIFVDDEAASEEAENVVAGAVEETNVEESPLEDLIIPLESSTETNSTDSTGCFIGGDSFMRGFHTCLELSRKLKRVATVEEVLGYLKEHGLYTGEWSENEEKRRNRIAYNLEYVARTFDPEKTTNTFSIDLLQYQRWVKRHYPNGIGKASADEVNIFLSIAKFCLVDDPNEDGSLPYRWFEAIWKGLYKMKKVVKQFRHSKWAKMRDTLVVKKVIRLVGKFREGMAQVWVIAKKFPGFDKLFGEKDSDRKHEEGIGTEEKIREENNITLCSLLLDHNFHMKADLADQIAQKGYLEYCQLE